MVSRIPSHMKSIAQMLHAISHCADAGGAGPWPCIERVVESRFSARGTYVQPEGAYEGDFRQSEGVP